MSYTHCGAAAHCKVALYSTRDATMAVYDYLVNHPEEIPESIDEDDDMDSDACVKYLERYIDCNSDGHLTVSYDTEGDNYSTEVFDFLLSHFCCLMASPFMTVNWWLNDSRSGGDSGTDYYDKQYNLIDVAQILTKYFEEQA